MVTADPCAHPAYGLAPNTARLEAVDLLRGVALLGILIVNMQWFAMPNAAAANPYALGPPLPADLAIWFGIELFAEGKFIAMFALLFGAGIVLMTSRLADRGVSSGLLHYRRMAWLLVFGLLHAYLLWHGDILVLYALCGMLVYPCRRLSPGSLVVAGLVLMALPTVTSIAADLSWPLACDVSRAEWSSYWQPSASTLAAETTAFKSGWLGQEAWRAHYVAEFHLVDMVSADVWHVSGLMLIGMALLKSGVLAGNRTRREYAVLAAVTLPTGFSLVAWGLYQYEAVGWQLPDVVFVVPLWNYWGSLLVAIGYIAVLLMAWKAAVIRGIASRLVAVGRTAFSGYILQTLICTMVFYGDGLGLFATVNRAEQLWLTVAIWVALLVLSPLWLRRFRYGPLEWLWRRLTYGVVMPLREAPSVATGTTR